jgi:NitT/TauT family transport system substrate-binding protein
MDRRLALLLSVIGAIAVALVVVVCRSTNPTKGRGGGGTNEAVTLHVGAMPVAECALLLDTNAFKDYGLQLEIQKARSGAQISDGVIGGGLDFGYSNFLTPLLANNERIPLRAIGVASVESDTRPRHLLLVPEQSRIRSPGDLVGAHVAVNALNNIDHVLLRRWLLSNKVDPETVKFTVVGFPDMLPQLKNGAVDAVALVEPYVTLARMTKGFRPLANYYVTPTNMATLVSGFVAREDWLKHNPKLAPWVRRACPDPDSAR